MRFNAYYGLCGMVWRLLVPKSSNLYVYPIFYAKNKGGDLICDISSMEHKEMDGLRTEEHLGSEMGAVIIVEDAAECRVLDIANSPVSSEIISQLFYESSNCWKKESFEKLKQYGEEGMLLAKGFLMRMYAFGSGLAKQDGLLAEQIAKEILPILRVEAEYRNRLKVDLEKRIQTRANSRKEEKEQHFTDAEDTSTTPNITMRDESKEKEEDDIISNLEKEVKELKYVDYLISSCYHKGIGVASSEDLSFQHAFASSLLGYAPAQNYVGYCFEKGVGTSISLAEALRHYHLAADQNHAAAQYNLGLYYKNKRLPVYDEKKSFTYFMQSAMQNNIDSQYFVGIFYQEGVGMEGKNDVEAVKWFRRSAEQGCLWSQNSLGRCYKLGLGVEEKSFQDGAKWYMSAAFQQYGVSQHNLAFCYKCAEGVPRSDRVALYWFELSAEKGDKDAQYHVGMYHLHGANPHHYVLPTEATAQNSNINNNTISENADYNSNNKNDKSGNFNVKHLKDHNFTSQPDWKLHFPVPTSVDDLLQCDAEKYAVNADFLLSDYVPVNIPRACYFLEKAYSNGAPTATFYYALCLLHPEYHLYLRQLHRSNAETTTNTKKNQNNTKNNTSSSMNIAYNDDVDLDDNDVDNVDGNIMEQESIEDVIRSKIKLGLSLLETVSESSSINNNKGSDASSPITQPPVYTTQLMATYLLAEAYYLGFTNNGQVYGQDAEKAFHLLYDTILASLLKNVHKVLVTGIAAVVASNILTLNDTNSSVVHHDSLGKLPTWTNLLRNSVNMASSSLTYHGRMAMAEACALLGYAHAQYQGRLRLIPPESNATTSEMAMDIMSLHLRDVQLMSVKEKEQHHRLRDMFYYLAYCWRESISTSSSGGYHSNSHNTSTNINGGSTQYYYYHWTGLSRGLSLALAMGKENERMNSYASSNNSTSGNTTNADTMCNTTGNSIASGTIKKSDYDAAALDRKFNHSMATVSSFESTKLTVDSFSFATNPINVTSKDYQLFSQILDALFHDHSRNHCVTVDQEMYKRMLFQVHTGRKTISPIAEHSYQPYLKHDYNNHYKDVVTMLIEQTPTVTHYPNQAAILANDNANALGHAKTVSNTKTLTGEYIGYGRKLLPFLPTLLTNERTNKQYAHHLPTNTTDEDPNNDHAAHVYHHTKKKKEQANEAPNPALVQDACTLQHVLYALHLYHMDHPTHVSTNNTPKTLTATTEPSTKPVAALKSFPAINIPELLHKRDPFLCYNLALAYSQAPTSDSFAYFQDLLENPSAEKVGLNDSSQNGNKIDVYGRCLPPMILTQDHGEAFRLFRAAAEGALFCTDFDYVTLRNNTLNNNHNMHNTISVPEVVPFANVFAYFALAWCYRYGAGIPSPVPNASVHYLSIPNFQPIDSNSNHVHGMRNRQNSSLKQRRHYHEARRWFARVAENEEFDIDCRNISSELDWKLLFTIAQARYELGIMWHKGRGGDRDVVEAWYHMISSWLLVSEDLDGIGKKANVVQKVEVKQAIINWVSQEICTEEKDGGKSNLREDTKDNKIWKKEDIVQGLTSLTQKKTVHMQWLRDWRTRYHRQWEDIQHQYHLCLLTYLSSYNALKTSGDVDFSAIEWKIEDLRSNLASLQDRTIEELCQAIFVI